MAENHPYHIQTFTSGANYDVDPELVGEAPSSGIYIDSHNGHNTSVNGFSGAFEKIKGEVLTYNGTETGYKCIGSESVNDYLIEFWAPLNPAFPGIVRVNGVVVLSSVNFPLRQNYPLQWDKNRSASFSEIIITDNQPGNPPYLFNIKDMVDSLASNPNKYFSAFDPELYQLNLQTALDIPVFIELTNVGGGGGLPPGNYQYQLRYSNKEGDRTQWSHPTPMIPVVQALSEESAQYPYVKTYGGPPNPSSFTSFAPVLRFRVTNVHNYDFIEIKRTSYNAGAGIEFTNNGKIVARIDVGPGEIGVRDYIDPSGSNVDIALSSEDETRELAYVDHCKSIRYFDRRVVPMNVVLASKESDLTFEQINGKEGFPVIENLGKAGHNDPYNFVYKRNEMRGEIAGFAIGLYDGAGNKGYATKIPQLKNYQFPNRRDVISTETENYSHKGVVRCADYTANAVNKTHEVFEHYEGIAKQDLCNFKNICENGRVLGLTGTKTNLSIGGINQECDEDTGEIENHGARVSGINVSVSYQPFHPVRANDADVTGHDYKVTSKVSTGNITAGVETEKAWQFRPAAFAPNYYAMGMAISGVDNFPKWAKSFAVLRTDSPKKVVCQGLGFYALTKANYRLIDNTGLGGKDRNKFWFYSPDINNGIVSSDTINDLIDNPQNYKAQCVSPLGFFSEFYSAEDNLFFANRDRCVDMISYVRMLRDYQGPEGSLQINPGESSTMGIPGGDTYNYITHDKWRNSSISNYFTVNPERGNRVINITQVKRVSSGRGEYIELLMDQDIYNTSSSGGDSNSNFEDGGLKNFHEPMYIINIIKVGAQINDNDTQKYRQTSHYQKIESIIGKSTGVFGQKMILVDERWEDCIPHYLSTGYGAQTDRFIYVKKTDGVIEKWVNVTYKSAPAISTITSNIAANIGDIKGIYTHNDIDGNGRFFEIVFNQVGFTPELDSLVLVRYDKTAPISVFGGDSFIGEAIFAPIDKQASARDDAAETQFAMGIGFPYKNFKLNPRYYTIRKAGASVNAIQDKEWYRLGYIRQLCAMFTVESRICVPLAHNAEYPRQFFPLINYVIRPNRWDQDKNYKDNHIFDDYSDDYGDEKSNWKWGGFRFLQQINPDYSVMPKVSFFSKPKFGFEERREFKTRIMWSLPRVINAQNSPGLRTFPANNSFDCDDDQGEIKFAWDANSDRGDNLYAICNTGVVMLVTKKSILSDLDAGQLGYMSKDSFITGQLWTSRETGSFNESWRGIKEANAYLPDSKQTVDMLFIPTDLGIFKLMNNSLINITDGYNSKIETQLLELLTLGNETHITAAFDNNKQQYYLHVKNESISVTFVYSQEKGMWIGTNGFTFDRFTSKRFDTYGHRDFKTYKLNEGYVMNGSPVEMKLLVAASPEKEWEKEWVSIRVNSPQKPTSILYYKQKEGVAQAEMSQALQGPLYLKNYGGWENFIPRIKSSVDANRPLLQSRVIFYEIIHNLASEFRVIDVAIQYKKLKLK